MPAQPRQPDPPPIGETLRERRVAVMNKSLRETAKLLDIAPAHLTDIEKGRRNPSQELLLRIARVYNIDESTLRAGWGKAQIIVGQIASKNPTTAAKAPELLRAASDLNAEQWDKLIAKAKTLAAKKSKPVTKKKAT